MKAHNLTLILILSMSSASHAQDLLGGIGGLPVGAPSLPALNLLEGGLPTADLLGSVTPLAFDLVNTALPMANQLPLNATLPVLTGLGGPLLGSVTPLAIDAVNATLPTVNQLPLGTLLPIVTGLTSPVLGNVLPGGIDVINTAAPILGNAL